MSIYRGYDIQWNPVSKRWEVSQGPMLVGIAETEAAAMVLVDNAKREGKR